MRTCTGLEDGSVIVFGVWGSGNLVGHGLTHANPYWIESLTLIQASPIARSELSSEQLVLQLQQLEKLLIIRSGKRVDVALLNLLNWLAQRFGQPVENGQLIDLRLTHQDLAELLGITRVTVTRVLNQLEQQGQIQRLPLQRIILQPEGVWHYEI